MRPLALCALLAAVSLPRQAAAAPSTVTLVGDLQSELGCPTDSDPTCVATQLELEAPGDGIWQKSFNVPAGTWKYKISALEGTTTTTHGGPGGADITLTLASPRSVKFYFDPNSKYVSDNVHRIAVAPGNFQSELGCPNDWQPECLKSWLQDPDGDGIFVLITNVLPVGSYEGKVAINESWDENYGANGAPGGSNIGFRVTSAGQQITFTFDSVSKKMTIKGEGEASGDILLARAHWVAPDTLAWSPDANVTNAVFRLHHDPTGAMNLTPTGIENGSTFTLTRDPQGLSAELRERFPHLANYLALKVPANELAKVPQYLKGQLAVSATVTSATGQPTVVDATSVQLPGVLDALYTYTGELGPTFDAAGVPTLRVWAPTARKVTLLLFDDSTSATPAERISMTAGSKGEWSAKGTAAWKNKFYLYEVEVYVRKEQAVKTNLVTDPYSVSLSMNSTRSQIVDLNDPALTPPSFASVTKPPLAAPEDIVLYELHVRDFSASDDSVPANERGTFKAFTRESNGTKHLTRLAKAGVTHVHLLPVFDIATINEDRTQQKQPAGDLSSFPPDFEEQQKAVTAVRDADAFNWGYDPYHYTVPEGSYSTNPDGTSRIVEFREMVSALNQRGLRVVMDVVYNHTTAAGQDPKAVLDRIVPGYYHRLNGDGNIETSTCCQNTATEHAMMEKLMVDSLVTWARAYKVDGFRFDLMGHHMKANMLKARAALNALTLEHDGVDGRAIYMYGEGWNFGEVLNGARGVNATQLNMPGTGIGTFSDRLRDAARGGGPFSGVQEQGFISGLYSDPNGTNQGTPEQQKTLLLQHMDRIRVGLAGNLRDYSFTSVTGEQVTGAQVRYGDSPAGYTLDPQEVITYVSAHDNETLFDAVQLKAPRAASMDQRVRMHNLGISLVALAQGIPFFHAGDELLRSKSMDRNSYNSGDWFNRIDWTYQTNNWGVGLPPSGDNGDKWALMKPLLADPNLKPAPAHIQRALEHFEEMIRIRKSADLFRLRTGGAIERRVRFENTGPNQVPGLIVMAIEGDRFARLGEYEQAVVLFNGADEEQRVTVASLKDAHLELHPVLKDSTDPVVRSASFDAATGGFVVPARTTAVFVQNQTPSEQVPILDQDIDVGGCAVGGGAAFSALALLGLSGLLRSRRRKP